MAIIKLIKRIKMRIKEWRIKRFRAKFKESYPDAEWFISKLVWLNGTDQFWIDGRLIVDDVTVYHNPTEAEQKAIDDWLGQS